MIETIADGIVVNVKVMPRAGRSEIAGVRNNLLVVRLSAAPVDGAANAELMALLGEVLGVPKRAISIVTGTTARQKRIRITGITADRAASRLPH